MSEKLSKPEKESVPHFVGQEDAEQKPMPQKPETNLDETPLFKKIDKLTEVLEEKETGIIFQLCRIADTLEKLLKESPTFVQTSPTTQVSQKETNRSPPPEQKPTGRQVEDVRMLFTKELEELLNFEDKDGWIRIAPKKYLGSDNFAKIAGVIRTEGGEYISAGRDSHFKLPK